MPNDYADKIKQARDAGYNDDEIASFIAQSDQKMAEAVKSGYSGKEILSHLEQQSQPEQETYWQGLKRRWKEMGPTFLGGNPSRMQERARQGLGEFDLTEAEAAEGFNPHFELLRQNINSAQATASLAPGMSTRGMPEPNLGALAYDTGHIAGKAAAATKEGVAKLAYTPENKLRPVVRASVDALGGAAGGYLGHLTGNPEVAAAGTLVGGAAADRLASALPKRTITPETAAEQLKQHAANIAARKVAQRDADIAAGLRKPIAPDEPPPKVTAEDILKEAISEGRASRIPTRMPKTETVKTPLPNMTPSEAVSTQNVRGNGPAAGTPGPAITSTGPQVRVGPEVKPIETPRVVNTGRGPVAAEDLGQFMNTGYASTAELASAIQEAKAAFIAKGYKGTIPTDEQIASFMNKGYKATEAVSAAAKEKSNIVGPTKAATSEGRPATWTDQDVIDLAKRGNKQAIEQLKLRQKKFPNSEFLTGRNRELTSSPVYEGRGPATKFDPVTGNPIMEPNEMANSFAARAVKIFTDSNGTKWAEAPGGVRVSVPKNIPEETVMEYARSKLAEQAEMQRKIKGGQ